MGLLKNRMIPLKSESELVLLRKSGKILSGVMQALKSAVVVGVATGEIDNLAEALIKKENAEPAFKGYKGYPATICISINEEIVHGIPGERCILEGDLVSIDCGVKYEGYFSDAAFTVGVSRIDKRHKKLIEVTREALAEGIKRARVGNRLSDISHAVQSYAEGYGFAVVRQFVGHGIGRNLHEEPEIPNYGMPNCGARLESGMVLAIEPMINLGTWESKILDNGWTAVTVDGLASAHFEHTVIITENGPEIITQ